MPRGSHRHDAPSKSRAAWINYNSPVESWECWENTHRFGQPFTPALRKEIALAMTDLSAYRESYQAPPSSNNGQRLDAKQIQRELKAAMNNGAFSNPNTRDLVIAHCPHLPDASDAELARDIWDDFKQCPTDFLMERPMPNPLFTRVFFEIFHRHKMNVSIGSAGTLYGMSPIAREKQAPETPFAEFVRRSVWRAPHSSASFSARVRKIVQRCPICSNL